MKASRWRLAGKLTALAGSVIFLASVALFSNYTNKAPDGLVSLYHATHHDYWSPLHAYIFWTVIALLSLIFALTIISFAVANRPFMAGATLTALALAGYTLYIPTIESDGFSAYGSSYWASLAAAVVMALGAGLAAVMALSGLRCPGSDMLASWGLEDEVWRTSSHSTPGDDQNRLICARVRPHVAQLTTIQIRQLPEAGRSSSRCVMGPRLEHRAHRRRSARLAAPRQSFARHADLPMGTGCCPTSAVASAMQNTQSWADIPVEVAEEPIYPAGFQLSGRLCSIWNCSITVDPSIGWPSSPVDLNSRTSPKPCVLTSARIFWAWSSVA